MAATGIMRREALAALDEERTELLQSLYEQLDLPSGGISDARREVCLELAAHLETNFRYAVRVC